MAGNGILLAWLEPQEAAPSPDFDAWRQAGGSLDEIPGVSLYSVLVADDAVEAHKPYRYQIAYVVDDLDAITPDVYEKAIAAKPSCIQSTEWHLYKQLLSHFRPDVTTMDAGSVCVQVGQTPKEDSSVLKDFDAWFEEEHLPMLTKVPGWSVRRRMRFVRVFGTDSKEYAAPYIAAHRYEAENGLNGPEWQASVHTEWTERLYG